MLTERGDGILETLSELAKSARTGGLPRTEEALSDALITVYNALCDDRRARERGGHERPWPLHQAPH